ncbi:MAG TPA: protein kinase [Kofleriaceae bacterium]|nr:protein kinase [Kofleriaceae bacterium]
MKSGELISDRFAIEQRLGAGGMGEVFRARDPVSGEAMAVKVISDAGSQRAARFAREAETLATLEHPGIVRYVSHGVTASGELFLVMEWLEGEDLGTRLDREPLTVGESIALVTRVAEALGAAHARGIVHRDLKPSNLFLVGGQVDQVKILDFGIALREGQTPLTRTGVTTGTPMYMAPEQARTGDAIDARADVFALGCVLFQCLTGVPPYSGDTAVAVLVRILFDKAPRLRELWPEAPEDLDALVAQMLAKEPAQRPSDGANLAAALASLGPLTHAAAAVPVRHAAGLAPSTDGSERRLLSVIVLGAAAEPGAAAVLGAAAEGAAAEGAASAPARAAFAAALERVIQPYGGRLELLADGSAIIVLAPERQVATDQAAQAARCALALLPLAAARGRSMAIAMGRSESAQVLPGGDLLERAGRLLEEIAPVPVPAPADAASIALDEVTAGLLDARFDVAETERGHWLRGERPLAEGARTLLGRPTSCVGRDWEIGMLTGLLDECIDERAARGAIVTAAAGIGKSRLAAELVSRIRERDSAHDAEVAIWIGRGDSLRAGATLDLLAQALRGALGIRGAEPLDARRELIRARVAQRVPAAEQQRVTAFLGELIGTPFPDDGEEGGGLRAARHDAQLMSEQMRRAWLDFLAAETSAHPVLLVLEDLHWGDFGTVRFIDAALRERSDRPWMVLALARPEVFEAFPGLWAERQHVQEIRLKELGRKAGERLVRQVLGGSVRPAIVEQLVRQADGNAFYLEELIRATAEGKGRALPETVLAMVETRLDRLPLEARRVLRAASVFGEVCWDEGVARLLERDLDAAAARVWLARLVEQELLTERPAGRFPGARELAFRHALLREGAHATVTDEDRRRWHQLAGEWLEQHGERDPMVLAGHFERGGERTRAAGLYLRAAQQSLWIPDMQATLTRATLGLACEPPPELRLALLGIRCEASQALQQISSDDAEELLRAGPPGGIPWSQGMISYILNTLMTGRIGELMASLEGLRDITPAPDARSPFSLVLLIGISVSDTFGKIAQGTALEASLHALVRAWGDREPRVRMWWHIVGGIRSAHAHDDPWAGFQHGVAIQAIRDDIGGEVPFLNAQMQRGMNGLFLGALAPSAQMLEEIRAADAVFGMVASLRRLSLAWLYADQGELDRARAVATELREAGRASRNPLEESRGRWALAEVLRRVGELDGAEREVAAARELAVPLDQPGVLGTLAALRLAQGRAAEALAAAEDALGRIAAMGGCSLFRGAFVRLAHAEALHATGAHDAARRAIADARARLEAIAGRIADPGYRRSFLEDVPENRRTLALALAWLGPEAA